MPGWSITKKYYSLCWNTQDGKNYNASRGEEPSWRFSSDPRILIGSGAFTDGLDTVRTTIRPSRDEPLDFARIEQLFLETEKMVRKSTAVAEGASLTLVHWELLNLQYKAHRGVDFDFGHYEAFRALAHRGPSLVPGDQPELVMRVTRFIPLVATRAYGRRPCLTER